MIGELVVRQFVSLDEADVAEYSFHPLFGQGSPFPTQEFGKNCVAGPAGMSVMFGVRKIKNQKRAALLTGLA